MEILDIALWDINARRAIALKDRLDMFSGDSGATLIPVRPSKPIRAHDVVFLSFDECGEPVLNIARAVRKSSEMTFMLLINDRSQDLTPLFRPKIRPGGVLFRPVQNAQIRDILEEISSELDRLARHETDDVFVFKADGALRRVYFRDILFFEASLKKVQIHAKGQETGYYDSLENLSASLPPYFVRCHRGFIVNTRMIKEYRGPEMELGLAGGERIPFSRSYRNLVRQAVSKQANQSLVEKD